MQGRSAIWFLVLVLALLAALTLWIEQAVQAPPPKRDGSTRHDPDYRLNNFSIVKTDRHGNLRHALAAAEMVHYPDDDSTELTDPHFAMYTNNQPSTQIRSKRGRITSDGKDVYFIDAVKVVRGATRDKGEMTVETSYLHIIPEQDIATTDRPVVIRQAPGTVIHANGMKYNKKLGTLELYKRARVHYERPGKRPPAR